MFEQFTKRLKTSLAGPLPGLEVQSLMAPAIRKILMPSPEVIENARQSGVLVLIYPVDGIPHLVLMKRVSYEGVHSGQVCFPGGQKESGDRDLIATALRETAEEVGVAIEEGDVIGSLSKIYIPPSNFMVEPVVAFARNRPVFKPDFAEVASLIEVPLAYLLDPANRAEKEIEMSSRQRIIAPYYDVHGHTVWGATAMMLSEFLHIVKKDF